MDKTISDMGEPGRKATPDEEIALQGITVYPASEDIYRQSKEEADIDPENITAAKAPNEDDEAGNEKDFNEDQSGNDLDIPGAELDDDDEAAGNEDEENNHYSLGGDNHNDLDEDNGS